MAFCLDTSAWIDLWVRRYPQDVFPRLWAILDEKARDQTLLVPDEVVVETAKKDDGLTEWLKERGETIVKLGEPIQEQALAVLARFPRLVNTQAGRSQADPFVIATAIEEGATVVTSESHGTVGRPRIPFVCEALELPCIQPLQLLRALRIRL